MKLFIKYILCFSLFGGCLFADTEEVVVIGSGPAGLSAAIYAARAGHSTLVIEGEEPFGQIALSYKVDNFPGFPEGITGHELGSLMRTQAEQFGARFISGKITDVDLSKRPFTVKREGKEEILAKSIIIASGAANKWLGLPSEQALIGKGVYSCALCDGIVLKDQEAVVVGGGDGALNDALFLSKYASKVTVVHRRDTLRASPYLQKLAFADPKIHFVWNKQIVEIADPTQDRVTGVTLEDINTGKQEFLPTQGVFVAIGHVPNTALFEGQLALDDAGHILVEPFSTQTAIPGVFAAGDVVDSKYRQAITAAGTGSMAGIDAQHFIKQDQADKQHQAKECS